MQLNNPNRTIEKMTEVDLFIIEILNVDKNEFHFGT